MNQGMKRPMPQRAILLCCAAALLLDPGAALAEDWHAVAFMYHRFGEDRYPSTSVTLEQFDAHLDHLQAHDYTVWPLARLVEHLHGGRPVPDRTVAITMDDAYLSVYQQAHPRLAARGMPYTVFVATDAVDENRPSSMTWAQMREMQAAGASFANHTASHDYLVRRRSDESTQAYTSRIRADMDKGRRRLEEELGADAIPPLFAYPYGEYNSTVADLARDMGYTAFGQHSGVIGAHADPRALPRFAMAEAFANIDDFTAKAAAKALPVASISPWEPVLGVDNPPAMRVRLHDSDARLEQLTCFIGGQGRVDVTWEDHNTRTFSVKPPKPLATGRTRYNCTAPSTESGRYYWFSQQWVVLPD